MKFPAEVSNFNFLWPVVRSRANYFEESLWVYIIVPRPLLCHALRISSIPVTCRRLDWPGLNRITRCKVTWTEISLFQSSNIEVSWSSRADLTVRSWLLASNPLDGEKTLHAAAYCSTALLAKSNINQKTSISLFPKHAGAINRSTQVAARLKNWQGNGGQIKYTSYSVQKLQGLVHWTVSKPDIGTTHNNYSIIRRAWYLGLGSRCIASWHFSNYFILFFGWWWGRPTRF